MTRRKGYGQVVPGMTHTINNAGSPGRHLLSGHAGGSDGERYHQPSRALDWTIERHRAAGGEIHDRGERGERFFPRRCRSNTAMSQVTSLAMSDLYYLPPGTIPPMVMPF